MSLIKIDVFIATPVYKQIIHFIHKTIYKGIIKYGDILPFVNAIAAQLLYKINNSNLRQNAYPARVTNKTKATVYI
jgi:DNA-binding transcriptional regulator YhcF (GntR family)